jgi:hypothetical protein
VRHLRVDLGLRRVADPHSADEDLGTRPSRFVVDVREPPGDLDGLQRVVQDPEAEPGRAPDRGRALRRDHHRQRRAGTRPDRTIVAQRRGVLASQRGDDLGQRDLESIADLVEGHLGEVEVDRQRAGGETGADPAWVGRGEPCELLGDEGVWLHR